MKKSTVIKARIGKRKPLILENLSSIKDKNSSLEYVLDKIFQTKTELFERFKETIR